METAMNRIEKQAAFYRGYLADDRDLAAVIAVLVMGMALWLFLYLVSAIGPTPERGGMRTTYHATAVAASRPARP